MIDSTPAPPIQDAALRANHNCTKKSAGRGQLW